MKPSFEFANHRNGIAKKLRDMNLLGVSLDNRKKFLDTEKETLESYVAKILHDKNKKGLLEKQKTLENLPGFENFEVIDISYLIPESLKVACDFIKILREDTSMSETERDVCMLRYKESLLSFANKKIIHDTFEKFIPGELDNPHNVFHVIGGHKQNMREFKNEPIEESSYYKDCMHVMTSTENLSWYGFEGLGSVGLYCVISPETQGFKRYAEHVLFGDTHGIVRDQQKEDFDRELNNNNTELLREKEKFLNKIVHREGFGSKYDQERLRILSEKIKGHEDQIVVSQNKQNAKYILYAMATGKPVGSTIYETFLPLPKENKHWGAPKKTNFKPIRFTDISKYIIDLPNGILYRYINTETQKP